MRPMRKLAAVACPAFFLLPAVGSAQQINIHLDFDQEFDQVSPTPDLVQRLIQINATLSETGEISATNNTRALARRHKHRQQSYDENQLKLGATSQNEWKVAGPNKLINIVDLGSFKRAILLTVNGSTCSAEVDFELKPGYSQYVFQRKGGHSGVARSVVASRLNCTVGPSTGQS